MSHGSSSQKSAPKSIWCHSSEGIWNKWLRKNSLRNFLSSSFRTLANYRFLPEFIVLILFLFFFSKPVIDRGGGSPLVCYKRYPAVFCSTCTCALKNTLAHFLSLKLCVLLCNLVYLESVLVRLRGRVLLFYCLIYYHQKKKPSLLILSLHRLQHGLPSWVVSEQNECGGERWLMAGTWGFVSVKSPPTAVHVAVRPQAGVGVA